MRSCPVCTYVPRTKVFSMGYKIPDGWTLPSRIDWYTCNRCNMIYGDGDMNQAMFDQYYTERYGYGVSNPDNQARLQQDALWISAILEPTLTDTEKIVVDFGGAGDDGQSMIVDVLRSHGFKNSVCIGAGDSLPENVDVIYASHVLEHIYDLPKTMKRLSDVLAPDGLLIVDVPDATGLLNRWKMPILDFNTKHLNHFTLRNLLDLGFRYGFEAVLVKPYELEFAPCFQVHFKRLDVVNKSKWHIAEKIDAKLEKLLRIDGEFNIWGMSDIVWHVLHRFKNEPACEGYALKILDYIDNDPAYRGQTYNGKSVLERPDNDAPIVIMAQGQRKRLIENIRKMGIENEIIEL